MGHTQTHMSDTVDTRRVTEFSEKSEAELHAKLDQLADMVRSAAGSTVFFTGAGVSTAAGIADYRGPTGVWTRQRVKKLQAKTSRTAAEKGELELLLSEAKKKGKGGAAASTQLPSVMSSRGSPASSKKSSKPSTTAAFGAFGAFSSGLGAVGMSQEKLLQAHQSMAKLNEEMAQVETLCA